MMHVSASREMIKFYAWQARSCSFEWLKWLAPSNPSTRPWPCRGWPHKTSAHRWSEMKISGGESTRTASPNYIRLTITTIGMNNRMMSVDRSPAVSLRHGLLTPTQKGRFPGRSSVSDRFWHLSFDFVADVAFSSRDRAIKACVIILIVEALERLAHYSVNANLMLFLTDEPYSWTYFDAMQLMFLYMGFSYMMSVFGGWLGDSVLGMCAEGWICDGASLMFGALLNQQY